MPYPASRRVLIGAALLTVLGASVLAERVGRSAPAAPPAPAATAPRTAAALPLQALNATVVAVPPMIKETSVFGTLVNTGKTPIVLKGVRAEVAGQGMLMLTHHGAGGMQGMGMAQTLTVPAGGKLVLSDTGDHLMLMKLKRPLKVGETLKLLLTASDGRTFAFPATVKKP